MCQQLSPTRKGHHGSHSSEQWNHDCGRAADFGRSRALPRRHQAALLLNASGNNVIDCEAEVGRLVADLAVLDVARGAGSHDGHVSEVDFWV